MKKKIIIIIPYRGIGDLLFHIPLFKGIYQRYKSKLIIFSNKANKAKNILKHENYINKIEYLNFQRENQMRNSFELYKRINFYKPDLCILTAPTKRLILPLLISNSKKKVFFSKDKTKDLSKYILSQCKNNLKDINLIKNFDLNMKIMKKNQNIFISIDSHHDTNNWSEKNYIYLINKILLLKKIKKVYINFAPSKISLFKNIINNFRHQKKITLTYKKKFNEILNLINNSTYIIGNESGPICIAACLKKIIFSIYFPKYTNKSSKTINPKVNFFNSNTINYKNLTSKVINLIK